MALCGALNEGNANCPLHRGKIGKKICLGTGPTASGQGKRSLRVRVTYDSTSSTLNYVNKHC